MSRVLGVDCGSNITGFGIVDFTNNSFRIVECGVIAAAARSPFPERLKQIADRLRSLIATHNPEVMAV